MDKQLSALLAAMEILPDGLLVVDEQHSIVGCNSAAESLFGYRHGELVDQPLGILLPPAMREAHTRHLARFDALAGQRPMQGRPVLLGVSKTGTRVPVSIGVSTVGGPSGRLFVSIVRDARSMDDTLEEVRLLAETDPLTELGNRRYLSARLDAFQENAGHRPVALLFCDLDGFKPLNDQHGHDFGDEVLRIVARRLRGNLRSSDLCVRLGGDEFAVLLFDVTDPGVLRRVALKLSASVRVPIHLRESTVSVGVSIGGVIGPPEEAGTDGLFERADLAMYKAKREGVPYHFGGSAQAAAA